MFNPGHFNNTNSPVPNMPVGTPPHQQDTKHGTTTVAVRFDGGVVLVADKRASMGYMVASPRADKVHIINDRNVLTIAGSVADAQYVIKLLRAEINIYELSRNFRMTTDMVANLLASILYGQYRRFFPFFVGLLLGGYDEKGGHIYSFDLAGGASEEPYASTGSGSPFAYGALEAGFKEGMPKEDALKLALTALRSAIKRDIATGDGIDAVVVTKEGPTKLSRDDIKTALGEMYPFKE